MSISDVLRSVIITSGKSHAELERVTGIDRASIGRFVNESQSMRLDLADRLADHFGLVLTQGETMATATIAPNVFIFSAAGKLARQHYRQTIENGVSLEPLLTYITDPKVVSILQAAYPDGIAHLWAGCSGGQDEHYWDQMKAGDLILGYRNRRVVSASYFVAKVRSQPLAKFTWMDSRPFDLNYFITRPEFLDVPVKNLPQYFGRVYQGLRRLAKSEEIIRDFGSTEAFVRDGLGGIGKAAPDFDTD